MTTYRSQHYEFVDWCNEWSNTALSAALHAIEAQPRRTTTMSGGRLTLVPDETARDYLRRACAAPRAFGVPALGEADRHGEVVELHGPSASGKTALLLQICASWCLPDSHGGGSRRVVWIDCDGRLRPSRLRAAIYAYAAQHAEAHAEAAAADALNRIQVASCASSLELLCALEGVSQMAGEPPLVLVDSIGGFFWREVKPAEDQGAAPSLFQACVRAVGRLSQRRKAIVVCAKPKFFKANSLRDHREYLPREWTLLVKRRLVLSRAGDERMVARFGDPQSDFSGSFQFAVGADGCCVFGDVR